METLVSNCEIVCFMPSKLKLGELKKVCFILAQPRIQNMFFLFALIETPVRKLNIYMAKETLEERLSSYQSIINQLIN